jgi:hypothetical protein
MQAIEGLRCTDGTVYDCCAVCYFFDLVQMAAMMLSGASAVRCARQSTQMRSSTSAVAPCTPAFVARQRAGSLSHLKLNSVKQVSRLSLMAPGGPCSINRVWW